jgi:PST family polysaccharide transporter
MIAHIKRHIGGKMAANVVALYGAHTVNYIFPLVTVPYLFRVLGPSGWGIVAIAQGFGNYLTLIIDYGFCLSATREVARHSGSREKLAEILASVGGAKLALSLAGTVLALGVAAWIPAMRDNPAVLWSGVINGVALGLNPLWFFQGRERMNMIAALEIGAKLLAASGIFFLVRSASDAWRVLALLGSASLVSTTVGMIVAYRDIPPKIPSVREVADALRGSWAMFLFRSSGMLYTSGNSFLLGLFAPPQVVGYFAGAEKLSRAFMGMMNPFNQALFPRLNRLLKESPKEAVKLFRINAIFSGGGGILMGAVVFMAAPVIVRILFGSGLMPAVPVLRVMSLLPAIASINTLLGTQWMLPLGYEKALNRTTIAAGLLNVILAFMLAPRFQAMGMAWSVIAAELLVTVVCCFYLYRSRLIGDAGAGAEMCVSASAD